MSTGYVDAGHGHQRDFQEVNLKNEADTWLTSKDALAATDANGNNGVAAAGGAKQSSLSGYRSADSRSPAVTWFAPMLLKPLFVATSCQARQRRMPLPSHLPPATGAQ